MKLLQRMLGLNQNPYVLRYCQFFEEWELIYESEIVFMGSKQNCERYMEANRQ